MSFFSFQSETDYDKFYVFDGFMTQLKMYQGSRGDISYQWSGDIATFYWKTDGSETRSSMTAYIDF